MHTDDKLDKLKEHYKINTDVKDRKKELNEKIDGLSNKLKIEYSRTQKSGFFKATQIISNLEQELTIKSLKLDISEANNEIEKLNLDFRTSKIKQIRIARAKQIILEMLNYRSFCIENDIKMMGYRNYTKTNSKSIKKDDCHENILGMCKTNNITYRAVYTLFSDYFKDFIDDDALESFIEESEFALMSRGYVDAISAFGIESYEFSKEFD